MNAKHIILATLAATLPLSAWGTSLEERVEALETRNAELYHNLKERKSAGLGELISEHVSLSGLLEVEATFENLQLDGDDDENSSDLVLATAQLGFAAEVNDHLGATLILLYEEEEGEDAVVTVDEATLDYTRGPWFARLGSQTVPTGAFPSHMLSGPLTELGETADTALLVGFEQELFTVSAWAANGDAEHHDGAGHINDWGISVTATPLEQLELGAAYFSDFADSDAELVANYQERVAGWSAYAVLALGPVEVIGEVLGAADDFHANDLDEDGDGSGDRPLTWNLEVAAEALPAVEVAARVEGSDEVAEEPELQYGVCVSWGPWEAVSTSFEYLRGEFDEDFGGGVDSRNLFTAQLAVEF